MLAAALCAAAPLAAQDRDAQGQAYVVRPGDTLWDIARSCLGDPFLWPEVYRLNAGAVRDPARISPGQRLSLPVCREGAPADVAFAPADQRTEGNRILPAAGTGDVPVVAPGDFYRAAVLVRDDEVPAVGRLVERKAATVVPIAMTPQISPYDSVYVALATPGALRVGDPVHFFRRDREVKPYGHVFVSTGMGTVNAVDGSVATVVIRTLFDAVALSDLAVPAARFPVRPGVAPRAPRQELQGRIVGFERPHPVQATQENVFLDLGNASGVKEGDVFSAYIPATKRDWGTRPPISVGRVQVVRVTDRTATARITGLTQPDVEPGMTVRLVAEMP